MEIIPKKSTELDVMTREFINHSMRTPEVLRKIMEKFSNRELLKLSLVNKQWSFEARSILKHRGNVTARIGSRIQSPCQDLATFALDLARMRVVPFSGIHVLLSHYKDKASLSSFDGSMNPSYNEILDRLQWNHLAITFQDFSDKCQNCQALKFVRKVLKDFQGVLEELSLSFQLKREDALRQVLRQVSENWAFPRLKTITIKEFLNDESLTKFLKALVSRAPNLQALKFNHSMLCQENVLEGSSAVLVPYASLPFNAINQRMCEGLIRSLRAETIDLVFANFELEKEMLNQNLPMALQASRTSLKTLRMELLFAVPLMHYGICLENVTALEISMPRCLLEGVELHILAILTSFDFTCVFPKLQQVRIANNYNKALTMGQISDLVEQRTAWLTYISPDRAVNIKQLTLKEYTLDSMLPFWAQMFPHVETLSVNIGPGIQSEFLITVLWENFVNLEELTVVVHGLLSMHANLDSVFCGIFPEEVAELMEKDDEYLKAVNIVPVMPSIVCIKGLRTLKLDILLCHENFCYDQVELKPCPTTYLFSRVAAWIGFARCPELAVTFNCNDWRAAKAISHMKPYVSVVIKPPHQQVQYSFLNHGTTRGWVRYSLDNE